MTKIQSARFSKKKKKRKKNRVGCGRGLSYQRNGFFEGTQGDSRKNNRNGGAVQRQGGPAEESYHLEKIIETSSAMARHSLKQEGNLTLPGEKGKKTRK